MVIFAFLREKTATRRRLPRLPYCHTTMPTLPPLPLCCLPQFYPPPALRLHTHTTCCCPLAYTHARAPLPYYRALPLPARGRLRADCCLIPRCRNNEHINNQKQKRRKELEELGLEAEDWNRAAHTMPLNIYLLKRHVMKIYHNKNYK